MTLSKDNYCVIMAGGIGSRFWPMSTTQYPKQFIDVLGLGETLLQLTYNRFLKCCPKENIYVVTNEIYSELVKNQLPNLTDDQILLEPARRNTAPCIAYATFKIALKNPNARMVIAPSDHLILKEDTFIKAVNSCFKKASSNNSLLTLGIKPTRPDTGYGYIQYKESIEKETDKRIKKVKTFTEKPDLEMAKFFLESGEFLWNSVIFIASAQVMLNSFEKYMPEEFSLFNDGKAKINSPQEKEFIKEIYPMCKNISIDYGIMEKAENVYVRESIIGWSDLGTWGSLYEKMNHDSNGNGVVGKNVMIYNTKNCVVNMPKNKLVVIEGLQDYIVVESNDSLLICRKSNEQFIRQVVTDIKMQKGDKFV
ncbi:MAG: mannose-1-phosphate guanylyltransferase [Bacteroidota bacterium]